MRIGSLFSGIGGLELGLERAGVGTVRWQVEINPACRRILAKHWPHVTRYDDVRTLDPALVEPVDVLCGGFPCQDLSTANVRGARGLDGARSGLWREYLRIVDGLRPRGVVVENVVGLRTRGHLDTVAGDLDALGYSVEVAEFDAAAVGAPFRGARVFLVAATHGEGQSARPVDAPLASLSHDAGHLGHWGHPFTGPGRVADGLPRGVDRVRMLGNAVVPQMAYVVGRRLVERLGGA